MSKSSRHCARSVCRPKAAAAFIKSTYSGLPWRAPKSQTTVYHLRDFETERRHATLVAILIDTEATLTDEILDMHDRMIGSAFAKATKPNVPSNPRFRNRVSHQSWQRLFPGDRAILFWEQFTQSVIEAENWPDRKISIT